jgi:DivIVA domain-containing protein
MTSLPTPRPDPLLPPGPNRPLAETPAPGPVTRPVAPIVALEPAVAPEFGTALLGYKRAQVDAFVDDLRARLAAMRSRARMAENELRRARALPGPASPRRECPGDAGVAGHGRGSARCGAGHEGRRAVTYGRC